MLQKVIIFANLFTINQKCGILTVGILQRPRFGQGWSGGLSKKGGDAVWQKRYLILFIVLLHTCAHLAC
jgi:hypothetical protein